MGRQEGGGRKEAEKRRVEVGQVGIGRSYTVVLEIGIFVMCRVFTNPPSLVVRAYIASINQPGRWLY